MRLLRVLLALALLVPLAAAQGDPSGVSIEPETASLRVSVEAPQSIEFTVTHTGGLPPPLGQERRFVVTAETGAAGWTLSVSPATFTLAPGGTQTVSLQVAVATGGASSAEVTVLAQMARQGVPEEVPVAPLVDPAAEDEATLAASRSDDVARDIIERLGPGVWLAVLLLAIVAALILAVRLAMGRRSTIRLDAPERAETVPAGGKARFRLLVENTGDADDTVIFHVTEPAAGWAAFLPVPELTVRKDHVEELQLTVIAPKEAGPGDRQVVTVTANASGSGRAASQEFEVVIR